MAQNKQLRYQSSTPSTPDASIATYYVNTSGILHFVNPNGTVYQANQLWANNVSMLGQAPINIPSQTGILTGAVAFLPIVGPSGEAYCFPVYRRA
jgi:hypothetical protein